MSLIILQNGKGKDEEDDVDDGEASVDDSPRFIRPTQPTVNEINKFVGFKAKNIFSI